MIRFLLWEPIQEADAAWPDWQDHAQLGEAHLVQVAHLGDAHLGPERKAYEPERWLMGVQAQALALMSQFSSDRDSLWARGLYELVELLQ